MTMLPAEFSDLEPFADKWSASDMNERYQRRLDSTMDELQAFYDAVVPRAPAAIEYLNGFDLYDMPDEALNLLWMLGSLSAVSFAVDVFRRPRVPDKGYGELDWAVTPFP